MSGARDPIWMAIGTLVMGLSGYGYLSLIGHDRFDSATLAALSATYLLLNILGPGVFVASEQETSRRVSAALSRNARAHPLVWRLAGVTAALTGLTVAALTALAPLLLDRVLDDQVALVAALVLGVIGSALVYGARGLAGGQRRFRVYATSLIVDGGVRLLGCLGLVAAGSTDPAAFAMALCAGPLVAALASLRPSRVTGDAARIPVDPPSWTSTAAGVAWLLGASGLTMCLANLAPVIVTATLTDDPRTAAGFTTALVLTRIPLLLMSPVQALVLPGLSAAAADGRVAGFRRQFARGLTVVAVLGVLGVAVVGLAGPWILDLLFGVPQGDFGTWELEVLTGSAILFMIIQLCQPALIALHRHAGLLAGWVAGAAVFVACFLLPLDPVARALLAQVLAPGTVLAIHGVLIRGGLRRVDAEAPVAGPPAGGVEVADPGR